ncbi:MAG: molybdopterin converting factor subunit 1 [Myxococcota bacterium]|nr:molybdopterin converting factor subunit 1 [Myxococcota bacterium]
MRVRVLYFAALRELAGRAEESLELPAEVRTVDALRPLLEARVPALAGRLGSVRFARNEAFAEGGEALEDDDVIALIPPVAGGA